MRNVILVLTDDQTCESLAKMPWLGSRTGWNRFSTAFVNNPLCSPARATIYTGKHSHHTGVETDLGRSSFDDSSTIATWLRAAGYRTALYGKYHLKAVSSTYIPPGWDDYQAFANPTYGGAYFNYTLNENGVLVDYGDADADYSTDVIASKALSFLETAVTPFLLVLAPRAPHDGYKIPARHADELAVFMAQTVEHSPAFNEPDVSDKPLWWQALEPRALPDIDNARRKAWAALLAVDEMMAAIQAKLNARALMHDTAVIYCTDNAFAFGEHRWRGKQSAYDEAVRMPLLVNIGNAPIGQVRSQLVSQVDIAPTIAALAEVTPPAGTDGTSFKPLITSTTPPAWEEKILLRGGGSGAGNPPAWWALRTGTRKLIQTEATGELELYDLVLDPSEVNNVAADSFYGAELLELRDQLEEMKA